jgi:ribosomal protein S18 acetylase RimI-like enzyme
MLIRPFGPRDQSEVLALWQACGLTRAWNDPLRDIARKQAVQPDGFLVAERDGRVLGCVMVGYDGTRGWLHLLGVHPDAQRQGVGRQLVQAAERWLIARGGAKLNLQVRSDNDAVIAFYQRLGYQLDKVVSLGRRLIPDE